MTDSNDKLIFIITIIVLLLFSLDINTSLGPMITEKQFHLALFITFLAFCYFQRKRHIQEYRNIQENSQEEIRKISRQQQGIIFKYSKEMDTYKILMIEGDLLRRLGYFPQDLIGEDLLPLLQSEQDIEVKGYLEKAWKGEVVFFEIILIKTSILVTLSPIRKNGNTVEVVGLCTDITNNKQLENELIRTRLELQNTIDHHQGMIFRIKKVEGHFIHHFCQGRLLSIFGLNSEQVVGKTLVEFLPQNVAEQKLKYYEKAWNDGVNVHYELNVGNDLGSIVYKGILNPIIVDGQVVELIGSGMDITDKHIMEEEMITVKDTLDSIIQHSGDIIIILDPEGKILRVNTSFEMRFGWLEKEILGFPYHFFFSKHEYSNEPVRLFERINAGEYIKNFETVEICKNGIVFNLNLTFSPIHNSKGRLIAITVIGRDVSEITLAKQQLEESEQRYKSFFEHNPNVIFSIDTHGVVRTCNESLYNTLGYSPSEIIGKKFGPFIHESMLNQTFSMYNDAIAGQPVSYESRLKHKNGSTVDVYAINVPIFVRGEIIGIHGVVIDITEQKRDQKEIERLYEEKELLLQSTGEGFYGIDNQLNTISWNTAAEKMTGFTRDEVMNKKIHDLINPTNSKCFPIPNHESTLFKAMISGVFIEEGEEIFCKKDGTYFLVEFSMKPIVEEFATIGAVITFKDITERTKTEEYIRKTGKIKGYWSISCWGCTRDT